MMRLYNSRLFHSTRTLLTRWTENEDKLLLARYEELGPAWTALALSISSRSPTECRRRWLKLSGNLVQLPENIRKLVYEEGFEYHNGRLIRIPEERIISGPFVRLASAIEPVRFRSQRRKGGWSNLERMAVREGYEQFGPRWDFIAQKLQYRTGTQVRNLMEKQYVTNKTLPSFLNKTLAFKVAAAEESFNRADKTTVFSPDLSDLHAGSRKPLQKKKGPLEQLEEDEKKVVTRLN